MQNSVGSFEILDIQSVDGKLANYHARFTNYCESYSAIPTSGEIAFNVRNPSVPQIKIIAPASVTENQTIVLDASSSVDNIGKIESFFWSGLDSIQIANNDKAIATVTAPALNSKESKVLIFKLHVVDDEGYQAEKNISVTVMPDNTSSDSLKSGGGALNIWFIFIFFMIISNTVKRSFQYVKSLIHFRFVSRKFEV